MVDLFEHPDKWPIQLTKVIEKYEEEMDGNYNVCNALVVDLEKIGYTCDYGLDAVPYNLRLREGNKTLVLTDQYSQIVVAAHCPVTEREQQSMELIVRAYTGIIEKHGHLIGQKGPITELNLMWIDFIMTEENVDSWLQMNNEVVLDETIRMVSKKDEKPLWERFKNVFKIHKIVKK